MFTADTCGGCAPFVRWTESREPFPAALGTPSACSACSTSVRVDLSPYHEGVVGRDVEKTVWSTCGRVLGASWHEISPGRSRHPTGCTLPLRSARRSVSSIPFHSSAYFRRPSRFVISRMMFSTVGVMNRRNVEAVVVVVMPWSCPSSTSSSKDD